MSLHPTPPRPGTLTARVLAQLWFGPVELGQAAAELGCTAPQVFHTLMRLRSALHYNVATLGSGRYGLRPGVFPGRPPPRPGSLTARVQERLRVCPTISLTRDAARLSATPGQLLKSINALRLRWDLNIQRTAPGIFELRSGAYSERGYRGRQREPLAVHDLNVLLEEVLPTFAHQLKEQRIEVLRHPLPTQVACRRSELLQVFANLLANAIKFMGDASRREIELGGRATADGVECYVKDTGIGIVPEDQARIFQLFSQLQTLEAPGEGIGLAYVRKILRSHGGDIRVDETLRRAKAAWF